MATQLLKPRFVSLPLVPLSRGHVGYIPFEGRYGQNSHPYRALYDQCQLINLQPVKKMTFSFDPFHKDTKSIRTTMWAFSHAKIKATNVKCFQKTEILSDGGEPRLKVELNDGLDAKALLFKAANLTPLEIVYEFNKATLPLVVKKEEAVTQSKGKIARGGGGGQQGGKKK